MDGIEIVAAGPERLDALEPLWISLAEHHAELTPPGLAVRPAAEAWPQRRRTYARVLGEGAALFLAERSGEPVGFATAFLVKAPSSLDIDPLLEVDSLAVLPEERGEGIGTALMEAVEAWADAEGFGHLQVAVRDLNEGARRLYERRGFVPLYTMMVAKRERD